MLRRAGSEQDREQGLRDLEKAVSSGLDTATAYVFRGQLHVARQNPDLAIADCDEAIRRDPQIALAFAVRGAAFAQSRITIVLRSSMAKRSGSIPHMR